ncbi:hypothetical protein MASR2M48_18180 [Spirochaetota bacterium]
MGTLAMNLWRDALIVDRDDALIRAAKLWLGTLKTPFNKHELVSQIEAFLKRDETTDSIVSLLDRTDRLVLALALYSGTSLETGLPPTELARLVADEAAFEASALERLRNLKERLILYSYKGPRGREYVAVAPPLCDRLALEIPPSYALSTAKASAKQEVQSPFDMFCAILSACVHAKPSFKGKRDLSKRSTEILDAAAPGLASDKVRLQTMLAGLVTAGTFGIGADGRPCAYPLRFVKLCEASGPGSPLTLSAACSASGGAWNASGADYSHIAPGTLKAVLEALPSNLAFSPPDLRRICAMAMRRHLEPLAATGERGAQELLDQGFMGLVSAISETLVGLGFVILDDDGLVRTTSAIASALKTPGYPSSHGSAPIVVEESHEIRILPEANPSTRAFIAAIARLERTGLIWTATLDKAAAKAAYAYGFSASEIASRLEAESGKPLPQSVLFSLDAWEKEVLSARLRVGVIVALDGPLSGVLEHSPKAEGIVQEHLAEGIYLLTAKDVTEAERMLKTAGIEVDMRAEPEDSINDYTPLWDDARLAFDTGDGDATLAFQPIGDTLIAGRPALIDSLLLALDNIQISPEEKAQLEDKIHARLILDPSELEKPESIAEDKVVGALDYPGKLRILERFLKEGVPIELAYDDGTGTRTMVVGIPRNIRRMSAGMAVTLSKVDDKQVVIAIADIVEAGRPRDTTNGE